MSLVWPDRTQKSHWDRGTASGLCRIEVQGQSKRFGGAGFNPSHARITPPTWAGVPAELEEGEKAPSRAQGGQNRSWERTQPTQVLQMCKTQHSSPVGGWKSFSSIIKKKCSSEQRRAGRARWDPAEGNRARQEMKNGNAALSRTGKQQNKHNCGLPAPGAGWLRALINSG